MNSFNTEDHSLPTLSFFNIFTLQLLWQVLLILFSLKLRQFLFLLNVGWAIIDKHIFKFAEFHSHFLSFKAIHIFLCFWRRLAVPSHAFSYLLSKQPIWTFNTSDEISTFMTLNVWLATCWLCNFEALCDWDVTGVNTTNLIIWCLELVNADSSRYEKDERN